jgi:translocation and assembly module TamA
MLLKKIKTIVITGLPIVWLGGLFLPNVGQSATTALAQQHTAHSVKIEIKGLNPDLTAQVAAQLQYRLEALVRPLTAKTVQHWHQQATNVIQRTLAPYGYFTPIITSSLVYHPPVWLATYQIKLGPPVRITRLHLSLQGNGANNTVLKRQIEHVPLYKGDIFVSSDYEEMKQQLLNTAVAQGYLSAYFGTRQVILNRQTHQAEIDLILKTGPRYYFGPIDFKQSIFDQQFLMRYVPFKVGDPYSSDQVLALQNQLNQSGYFQRISVNDLQIEKQSSQSIPLIFNLTPNLSQKYSAGIGFSTDVGIKGNLGWESRYLNRWGHKLNIMSQLSRVQNSLQAVYVIPGAKPNTDSYNFNFAIVKKILPQVKSTTQQIGFSSRSEWRQWQRNLFINYQIERFNDTNQPRKISHLLTPGINFSRSAFENNSYPLSGYRLNFRTQGAVKNILSNVSFLQAQIQGRKIFSWNDQSRWLIQGDLGFTSTSDDSSFPPSLRFYAGGSQSIRGYSYQQLGPGLYLATASLEYQHRIFGSFYGTAFFDTGNASNQLPMPFYHGAGVGIVWASPFGAVELSVAKALNYPGHPIRIQFSMGSDLL